MVLEQVLILLGEVKQSLPIIERNQRKLIELLALTDYQRMKILLDKNITLIQETLKKNDDSLRIYNEEYAKYFSQILSEEEKVESDSEAKEQQEFSEKISTELNHALDTDLNLRRNIERYVKDAKENSDKYTAN